MSVIDVTNPCTMAMTTITTMRSVTTCDTSIFKKIIIASMLLTTNTDILCKRNAAVLSLTGFGFCSIYIADLHY